SPSPEATRSTSRTGFAGVFTSSTATRASSATRSTARARCASTTRPAGGRTTRRGRVTTRGRPGGAASRTSSPGRRVPTSPRLTGTGLRRRCSRVRTCWRCTRSSPAPTWTLPDALDEKWLTRLADQRQRIGMTTLRRGLALSLVVLVMGAAAPVTAKAKPTAAQKCTAAKLKASAKKLSAKLACWAKAAAKNAPVDDACTGKAETNFKAAFSTAESKGGCVGDATGVEANIEAFVQSEVTALHSDGTKDGGKC